MDHGQAEQDLKHIADVTTAPGPASDRLEYIADCAAEASRRIQFADLSDSDLARDLAMAAASEADARYDLQQDWCDARESAFIDAVMCLRDVRAEALRRGVTL